MQLSLVLLFNVTFVSLEGDLDFSVFCNAILQLFLWVSYNFQMVKSSYVFYEDESVIFRKKFVSEPIRKIVYLSGRFCI